MLNGGKLLFYIYLKCLYFISVLERTGCSILDWQFFWSSVFSAIEYFWNVFLMKNVIWSLISVKCGLNKNNLTMKPPNNLVQSFYKVTGRIAIHLKTEIWVRELSIPICGDCPSVCGYNHYNTYYCVWLLFAYTKYSFFRTPTLLVVDNWEGCLHFSLLKSYFVTITLI